MLNSDGGLFVCVFLLRSLSYWIIIQFILYRLVVFQSNSTKVRFDLLSCFVFISFKFCIRVSGLWNFPGASFTSGAYLFPPHMRSICSQRDLWPKNSMHSHLHMRQTLTCGFHKWTFFSAFLRLFCPPIVYVPINSDMRSRFRFLKHFIVVLSIHGDIFLQELLCLEIRTVKGGDSERWI